MAIPFALRKGLNAQEWDKPISQWFSSMASNLFEGNELVPGIRYLQIL